MKEILPNQHNCASLSQLFHPGDSLPPPQHSFSQDDTMKSGENVYRSLGGEAGGSRDREFGLSLYLLQILQPHSQLNGCCFLGKRQLGCTSQFHGNSGRFKFSLCNSSEMTSGFFFSNFQHISPLQCKALRWFQYILYFFFSCLLATCFNHSPEILL